MSILGLDIGGANIKAADLEGRAISRAFAIWRQRDRLQDEVKSILQEFPHTNRIALTMTAELADCFATKSEGVGFIVDAVEDCIHKFVSKEANEQSSDASIAGQIGLASASDHLQNRLVNNNVAVWSTDGRFLRSDEARQFPMKVAAANWHALAMWCGRFADNETGVLVDIGTTTTDIIPLVGGKPASVGLTDATRLQSGELSYSGISRTPLCAVAHSVPLGEKYCSLAAELFATTLDIHLLLSHIEEDESNVETANGKPATKVAAYDRIARMVCCDRDEVSFEDAIQIAKFLADVQRQRLTGSLDRVLQRLPAECQFAIISGSGSFLARQLLEENRRTTGCRLISLSDLMSESVSEAACAFAVAKLASEAG